jgi:AraC family transcriptional regulator, arabinose operon regulatory protein
MSHPHDAKAIYAIRYSNLLTGHYRMRRRYHIRRPRGTEDWLLIYTVSGRGVFSHARGSLTVCPGDLVLLSPGTPHDYGLEKILGRWELLWAHFHPLPTWMVLLNWPEIFPGVMKLSLRGNKKIVRLFQAAHGLATGMQARREWMAINALEGLLLLCDSINPQSEASIGYDSRVQEVVEHICRNLATPLNLGDLARVCHLSISRLSHLFRENLGMSPQRFIETQRMDRAKRLLLIPQMRIGEVAAEVGFRDPFYFSQRFRREAGMSPRAYREEQRTSKRR